MNGSDLLRKNLRQIKEAGNLKVALEKKKEKKLPKVFFTKESSKLSGD